MLAAKQACPICGSDTARPGHYPVRLQPRRLLVPALRGMRPGVRRQPSRRLRRALRRRVLPRRRSGLVRQLPRGDGQPGHDPGVRVARDHAGRGEPVSTPRLSGGSTSGAASGASSTSRALRASPTSTATTRDGARTGPASTGPRCSTRTQLRDQAGTLRCGDRHRGRRAHPGSARDDASDRLAAEARRRLLPDNRERRRPPRLVHQVGVCAPRHPRRVLRAAHAQRGLSPRRPGALRRRLPARA